MSEDWNRRVDIAVERFKVLHPVLSKGYSIDVFPTYCMDECMQSGIDPYASDFPNLMNILAFLGALYAVHFEVFYEEHGGCQSRTVGDETGKKVCIKIQDHIFELC